MCVYVCMCVCVGVSSPSDDQSFRSITLLKPASITMYSDLAVITMNNDVDGVFGFKDRKFGIVV